MNISKVSTVLIFFPFIIGCSSKEDSDVIENNVTEDIELVNDIQDDSIKPNSTGVFTFTPTGVLSDKSIDVYYHTPQGDLTNFPILFSFHGGSRNADDYRDDWIQMANTNNFMVFAPEFNSDDFPSGDMYNLANIFQDGDNPSSDTFNSPDSWTFSIIDQLFDFIKSEIGVTKLHIMHGDTQLSPIFASLCFLSSRQQTQYCSMFKCWMVYGPRIRCSFSLRIIRKSIEQC